MHTKFAIIKCENKSQFCDCRVNIILLFLYTPHWEKLWRTQKGDGVKSETEIDGKRKKEGKLISKQKGKKAFKKTMRKWKCAVLTVDRIRSFSLGMEG